LAWRLVALTFLDAMTMTSQLFSHETSNGKPAARADHSTACFNMGRHVLAVSEAWLEQFLIWDGVSGCICEASAVGLLPINSQGWHEGSMVYNVKVNFISKLNLMFSCIGNGKVETNAVILTCKDPFELLFRFVKELTMAWQGRECDPVGKTTSQAILIHDNKGSIDEKFLRLLTLTILECFALIIAVFVARNA
jgi:glucose-6-phosphate isomerase